ERFMTGRCAALFLLLLLLGSVGPFARAAFDRSLCCCPNGVMACPVRGQSCSFKSGCESRSDADPPPLAVFSLPSEPDRLTLAPGRRRFGTRDRKSTRLNSSH